MARLEAKYPETVHIALGSNLGGREANITNALDAVDANKDLHVVRTSSMYETESMGPPQPKYMNAAAEIECGLEPAELLHVLKAIETEMGREDTGQWGPRIIDLDIIFFGDRIINADCLTVPHRKMAGRRFVLDPMAEIAPEKIHPVLGKTVSELLKEYAVLENA